MIDLSTLNGNQRRAVEWDDGPLLVLAGPGSGKTRVLTYRIARLIESTPDKHFKVLALTFTNAAAAEMRQRLLDLIPNASQRVLSSTFHSFSADILRQHGSHVGLKPDFTLLSQNEDRQFLLNDALSQCDDTDLGPRVSKDRLLDVISYLIESSISPEDSTAELLKAGIVKADVISDVYEKYRSTMIARNLLDFPSLIAETLSLLRMQRGVQRQIQRIYPYICVDEFQDTNSSQASLLELLINDSTKNVFVAADDDQIIYQWNGASPQRIKEIQTRLNMGVVQLPQNYRCPPEVVDLANRLIANNYERSKDKQPLTAFKIKSEMSAVRLLKFPNVESEVGWIASDIYNRDVASRAKCIVLARTRAMLDTAVAGLNQAGLPGFLATKKNEFESASIQWLHSVLRLANAPASREQLKRVCLSYYTLEGINIEVGDVLSQAVADDGNLLRAWGHLTVRRLDQNSQAKSLLEKSLVRLTDRLDFWNFLNNAFLWLDSLPDSKPDTQGVFREYLDEKLIWSDLVSEICLQYGRGEVTLHLLLQELDLRSKTPPPPKNGIPCYTIHSSKGMEFNHVYLMGLVEDQLPSWSAKQKGDTSREMQEERRNCFVAITRAQETLTITYADKVKGWNKEPSRFLKEMGLV